MTGARELVESRVVSPAPDRVRLSFLGGRTQVDASLPLDAPIASLVPELVKLVRSRESTHSDTPDGPFAMDAKQTIWVVSRFDGKTPLAPGVTLREAGVADGELLRLTAQRTLSAPTLYDDVVDATARLNKAGYAGWNPAAARWMAYAGVHLVSVAWVYFLVAHTFAPSRGPLVGLSVVAALALVGVAALAHRSYGQSEIGAALGWAALPITAAVAWVALSGLGGYGLVAGNAAMVIVCVALYQAVGTGHWGYVAAGVLFAVGGIAFAVHTAGVPVVMVGAGSAVIATLGCLAVPVLRARSAHLAPPPGRQGDADPSNPFISAQEHGPKAIDAVTPPAGEGVWHRVRSATLTRSATYTGLATSAGLGVSAVLLAPVHVQWSGLAFASVCAATLGLYAQRTGTGAERAALAIPAVAITVLCCVLAQQGSRPMQLVAFAALLVATVASAVIGAKPRAGQPREWPRTVLAYSTYLGTAALIPLALWVADVYGRLGFE